MTVMVLSTCFDIVIRFRGTSCIFIQEGFLHNALCAHQLHRSVMPQCTPTISQPVSCTFVLHWKPENIQQTVIRCLPNHMVRELSNCLCLRYRTLWMNSRSEHAVLFSKPFQRTLAFCLLCCNPPRPKWINDPEVVSPYAGPGILLMCPWVRHLI